MSARGDLRSTLARNIRAQLAKRGQAVTMLADLAGVSAAHLYSVIGCEKAASIDVVERLANALEIEPWQLLRGSDDERTRRKPAR